MSVKNFLDILDAFLPFQDIKPHERRPKLSWKLFFERTLPFKAKLELFVRFVIAFLWVLFCGIAFASGQYIIGVLLAIVAIAAIGSVNKKTFSRNARLRQPLRPNTPTKPPLWEKLLYIASKIIRLLCELVIKTLIDFKNKLFDLKFINKSTWRANFSLKNNNEKYITLFLFLLTTAFIVTPIALGAEIYLLFAILPFLHLLVRTMHLFLVPEYYSIKNIENENNETTYENSLLGRIHRDDLKIINSRTTVKSPVQSKERTLEENGEIIKRHAAAIFGANAANIDPVTLAEAVATVMTAEKAAAKIATRISEESEKKANLTPNASSIRANKALYSYNVACTIRNHIKSEINGDEENRQKIIQLNKLQRINLQEAENLNAILDQAHAILEPAQALAQAQAILDRARERLDEAKAQAQAILDKARKRLDKAQAILDPAQALADAQAILDQALADAQAAAQKAAEEKAVEIILASQDRDIAIQAASVAVAVAQTYNYRKNLEMCLNLIDPNIVIPDNATAIRASSNAGTQTYKFIQAGEEVVVAEEEEKVEVAEEEKAGAEAGAGAGAGAEEVEVAVAEEEEKAGAEAGAGAEEVTTSLISMDQLNARIDQNIGIAKKQAKDGRLIPELAAEGLENKVLSNHDIIQGLAAQSPITINKKLTSALLIALLAGAGAGIYFLGANIGPGSEIVALMQSGSIWATIGAYAGIIILAFAFLIAAGALIYRINKTSNKPLYAVIFTLLAIVIPPLALGAISIIQAAIFLGVSALISAGLLYTARRNTTSFSLKEIIEKTKGHPDSLTRTNEIHLKTTLRYSLGEYRNDYSVKKIFDQNQHIPHTQNYVKIAAHFLLAYHDVSSSFPNTATKMVDIIRNAGPDAIYDIHDHEAKDLANVINFAFSTQPHREAINLANVINIAFSTQPQTPLKLKDVLSKIDSKPVSESIKAYAKKIATNYFLANTPGYIKTSNSKRLAVFVTSTLSTLMLALVFAATNNTFGLDFTPATINITIAIAAAIFISLLIMYFYKDENISSMAKLTAGLLAGASMITAAALAQVAVLGALGVLIIGFSGLYYWKDSKDNAIIKSREGSQTSKWFALFLLISGVAVAITLIALQEALPAELALTAIAVAIGAAITGIFILSRASTNDLKVNINPPSNTTSNILSRAAQQQSQSPSLSQSPSPSQSQSRRRLRSTSSLGPRLQSRLESPSSSSQGPRLQSRLESPSSSSQGPRPQSSSSSLLTPQSSSSQLDIEGPPTRPRVSSEADIEAKLEAIDDRLATQGSSRIRSSSGKGR